MSVREPKRLRLVHRGWKSVMTDNGRSIKEQIQGLSSVIGLKQKTKALRIANLFVRSKEVERQVKAIEDELTRITGIVERFYKTLGKRHWVFSDALSLDRVDKIVKKAVLRNPRRR